MFEDLFSNMSNTFKTMLYSFGCLFVIVLIIAIIFFAKSKKHFQELQKNEEQELQKMEQENLGVVNTCQYCGTSYEAKLTKCPNCSASVTRRKK